MEQALFADSIILQGITDGIPPGWSYPKLTYARMELDGRVYKTPNHQGTQWRISADILAHGLRRGEVTVGYLKEMPELDEGPFLKEERLLLNAISHRIGKYMETWKSKDSPSHGNVPATDKTGLPGGPLNVCSVCGHISGRDGAWCRVDEYFAWHTEAHVSPCLCPACAAKKEHLNKGTTIARPRLSKREREVLIWISRGKSTWEMSKLLGISESTIKFHVGNIMRKIDVTTRAQAVAVAMKLGIFNSTDKPPPRQPDIPDLNT